MSEEDLARKAISWAETAGQVLQEAGGDPPAIAYAHACAALSSAYSALKPPAVTMTRGSPRHAAGELTLTASTGSCRMIEFLANDRSWVGRGRVADLRQHLGGVMVAAHHWASASSSAKRSRCGTTPWLDFLPFPCRAAQEVSVPDGSTPVGEVGIVA
jgi:hypothetical protein